jgi:hypothetical protein
VLGTSMGNLDARSGHFYFFYFVEVCPKALI